MLAADKSQVSLTASELMGLADQVRSFLRSDLGWEEVFAVERGCGNRRARY